MDHITSCPRITFTRFREIDATSILSRQQHSQRNHPDQPTSTTADQHLSVFTMNKTNQRTKLEKPSPEPACLGIVDPNTDMNTMTSSDEALPKRSIKHKRHTTKQENPTSRKRLKVHEQPTAPLLQQTLPLRPVKRERPSDDDHEEEEGYPRVKKRSKVKSDVSSDENEWYTSTSEDDGDTPSGTASTTSSASRSEGDYPSSVTDGMEGFRDRIQGFENAMEGFRGIMNGLRGIFSTSNNASIIFGGNIGSHYSSSTRIRTHTAIPNTNTTSDRNFSSQNFSIQTFSRASFTACNLSSCSALVLHSRALRSPAAL